MSRFISEELVSQAVERWLPPDVDIELGAARDPAPEPPTPEEIAAIEEEARSAGAEAGFREGYEAGYAEGREQAAREAETERQEREAREETRRLEQESSLQETVTALERVALAFADPLAGTVDDLEPELLALVETLARRVIMEELALRPELIEQVLHEALAQLPSRSHAIRVRVHPDQQPILERYARSCEERIVWLSDPEVEPGGCVIESGPSRIDASLEARLRQSIDAIWGEVSRPRQDPIDRDSDDSSTEGAELEETPPSGAADVQGLEAPTACSGLDDSIDPGEAP